MNASSYPPVGMILPNAGTTPANLEQQGWLACNGRAVDRDEYACLIRCSPQTIRVGNLEEGP